MLERTVALAREAGRAIMDIYDGDFTVSAKADRSPLTAADLAAQALICAALARLTPGLPVLSEEGPATPYSTRRGWQRYWLVDPLDGTREFIKRNGEFTVNIALIEAGCPVLGVVHHPPGDVTWFATAAAGAWRQHGADPPVPLQARRHAARPPVIAASRSHAGTRLAPFLQRLDAHELMSIGSALKFCLVAAGEADCYPRLGPTSEWDTAAGQCIAEVAGCRVVGLDGAPLRYNARESLVNPPFIVFADATVDWLGHLDAGAKKTPPERGL